MLLVLVSIVHQTTSPKPISSDTCWWESGSRSNKINFYQNNMETSWTQSINPNKTNMQSKQKN